MKSSTKAAFRRGFTLIELMIVIVIIGILTVSLLPQITGGRQRAEDTARINDLNQIVNALEIYLGDTGVYPGTAGTAVCMKAEDVNYQEFSSILEGNFKNGVPTPPQPDTIDIDNDGVVECEGGYVYLPVLHKGQNPGAYGLVANVAIPTKGNTLAGFNYSDQTTLDDLLAASNATPEELVTAEETPQGEDGSLSLYMVTP